MVQWPQVCNCNSTLCCAATLVNAMATLLLRLAVACAHPMPGSMASDMKLICAPCRSTIRLLKNALRQSSTMPAEPGRVQDGRGVGMDSTLTQQLLACMLIMLFLV